MILTIVSFKGGVGKTTTAVHLTAYLQQSAPALLVDGDANRSALAWSKRGGDSLPFKVIDERQLARHAKDFEHIVIDTAARPDPADLKELAAGCDLLIVPTSPDALALDALLLTVESLRSLEARYRVLVTLAPPRPSRDGEDALSMLQAEGIPAFETVIRRLVAYQKAALAGVPVQSVADPRAAAAGLDYARVGDAIIKELS